MLTVAIAKPGLQLREQHEDWSRLCALATTKQLETLKQGFLRGQNVLKLARIHLSFEGSNNRQSHAGGKNLAIIIVLILSHPEILDETYTNVIDERIPHSSLWKTPFANGAPLAMLIFHKLGVAQEQRNKCVFDCTLIVYTVLALMKFPVWYFTTRIFYY